MPLTHHYDVIVIGGGHAGVEAVWAAANLGAAVALVTMDPTKIGAMSCNPAIGGLAKGQIVREIDALGGLMGLAADATGIQFRILNASKGPAVQGPRCQSDKYRYAGHVQSLLAKRKNIDVIAATVENLIVQGSRVTGLVAKTAGEQLELHTPAIVLTTGTFMRGLMHTGDRKTKGGRVGEQSAVSISGALQKLGFELGRLKTGTPPRLAAETINFDGLEIQPGDDQPQPFSDMTQPDQFPVLEQRPCWITHTNPIIHDLIKANLERAPMYNGQIDTAGPRYCPSIEDKVVRFADRTAHHIYLEPESLDSNEIYCNGISTSLPQDVQQVIVANLPGCKRAKVLRYGYAVEYDMVWPHQIDATCMTKSIDGLFLAGQINGTSGYEEAAGQGLMAGLNAARYCRGQSLVTLRRDQAYIGVMMDDLVTKTPREPYRMFTSRAEHRLSLRGDNADHRLTPMGRQFGLVDERRWCVFQDHQAAVGALRHYFEHHRVDDMAIMDWVRRRPLSTADVIARLDRGRLPAAVRDRRVVTRVMADVRYAGYIARQQRDVARLIDQEQMPLPRRMDFNALAGLRNEARSVLTKFQPATLGQAARLAGITPADVMVLNVVLRR